MEYDMERAIGRMRSVAELDVASCRFLRGELQIAYMRGQITGMQDASRISNPRQSNPVERRERLADEIFGNCKCVDQARDCDYCQVYYCTDDQLDYWDDFALKAG